MTIKQSYFHLTILSGTIFLIVGCNTTKTVYKSSNSQKDYIIIKAATLSHCGCTQLYADSYRNGKLAFQIFYDDNIARKTIFEYTDAKRMPKSYSLLATTMDSFTIPFDSLDLQIFNRIDSAIIKKEGFVYPIRWTEYKGYVVDTLVNR